MRPLIRTNPIHSISCLNQRILRGCSTLNPPLIRGWTEGNYLLFRSIVIRHLVDLQLSNRDECRTLVRNGGIIQVVIGIHNVRLDGEDDWFVRESLLKIILQIVCSRILSILLVLSDFVGIEMFTIRWIQKVSNIG